MWSSEACFSLGTSHVLTAPCDAVSALSPGVGNVDIEKDVLKTRSVFFSS